MIDEAAIWKTLYRVAAGFPDGAKMSQHRLREYFAFFSSLEHVLPSADMRKHWKIAISTGNGELSWELFSTLRSHKKLLNWLFGVHDEMARMQGHIVTDTFANRYARLAKGMNVASINSTSNLESVFAALKQRLVGSPKAMDEFLATKFHTIRSRDRRAKLRTQYLDEAKVYFWNALSKDISASNASFAKKSLKLRSEIVLDEFDERYKPFFSRAAKGLAGFPGAVVERLWY